MVSAVPVWVGGSRSLSLEPGIPLALLQGTLEPSTGAQTREPWLGWGCAHSRGHGADCALIAPISHGMEGKRLRSCTATSTCRAERAAQGEVTPRSCPGAGRGHRAGRCKRAVTGMGWDGMGWFLGVLLWG